MTLSFYIIIFFLGAIMGSFAGVIIERGRGGFERGRLKEIFGGRSICPWCGQSLTWWQLLPLIGWISQNGKCFRCKLPIPARYNWMEISMGIVFVVTSRLIIGGDIWSGWLLQVEWTTRIFWLMVNRALWAIIVADFFWYELNVYLRLFVVVWIMWRGAFGDVGNFEMMFLRWLLWTAIYGIIWRASGKYVRATYNQDGEGIGEGDVMMALVVGLLFPFLTTSIDPISAVQLICVYLIGSSALGIVFWLVRVVFSGNRSRMMPFLPAMIVAFWLLLAYAEPILRLIEL